MASPPGASLSRAKAALKKRLIPHYSLKTVKEIRSVGPKLGHAKIGPALHRPLTRLPRAIAGELLDRVMR